MMLPVVGYSTMLAFQWDFAYGTKANRIFEIQKKILTVLLISFSFFRRITSLLDVHLIPSQEEGDKYWFAPIQPTDEQLKMLSDLENFRPLKNAKLEEKKAESK